MSNKITKTVRSSAKFVSDHRVAIAVVATSTLWIYAGVKRAEEWNSFLDAHDLREAFYATGEE